MNYCILISTIVFFGLLGGLVNAIRTNQKRQDYWKSLVKGLVAALLVPVFLEIIKSELGRNLTTELYDYLIFGGLCLVAAIFSDKFIDTLGERILQKAREAEEKAEESNKKVDTVIDKRAEPEEDDEPAEQRILKFEEFNDSINKDNITNIIKSLKNKDYEYRTAGGIAKDTGLSRITVTKMLADLQKNGIVTKIQSDKRILWTLNK
jgi:CRP-like cAMP-binding protein